MAAWARERDPSRPLHYEHDWSCRDVDVLLAHVRRRTRRSTRSAAARRSRCADPALDARRRRMPFILCEYAHAMGNGPGRAGRLPGAVRAPPALPGRLRLGVDRPRHPRRRARLLRLRRRLRRAAARRQLRRRRAAVPGPHAVARAARAQEGLRAGADHRGRRRRPADREPLHVPRPLAPDVRVVRWRRRARRSSRASCASGRCPRGAVAELPLPDDLPPTPARPG